jgi:putative SOS response-associated peptidase YedK
MTSSIALGPFPSGTYLCSTGSWSRSVDRLPKIGYKAINARAETVDTAPSYREAFKKRRCLIPADGFYEWRTVGGTKVLFAIGMNNDRPFVFAGLWEGWKNPATGEWLRSRTIIRGEPNELVVQVDTRGFG